MLMSDRQTKGKDERPASSPAWELGQHLQQIPAAGKPPARPLESVTRREEPNPQPDGNEMLLVPRGEDHS
jgi:hypothetical protein